MNALNSRLFSVLYDDMSADHNQPCKHAEYCMSAFHDKNKLGRTVSKCQWIAKPAYLSDDFSWPNELTSSIQGRMATSLKLQTRLTERKEN